MFCAVVSSLPCPTLPPPPTYQLEFPATVVGILDARVGPQGTDGGQVLHEDLGVHQALGHHGGARVERHHGVAVRLIGCLSPGDVELLAGVHQHPYTCEQEEGLEEERKNRRVRENEDCVTPR